MGIRGTGIALGILLAAAGGWALPVPDSDEADRAPTARVHTDAKAMKRAMTEALEALMRDDIEAVGPAVREIDAACRVLHEEDDDLVGPGFRQFDQALHLVLLRSRGFATDGDADEAFTEFVWVLRTCRQCHDRARSQGLLPETGALWDPTESAEHKPAETTQSAEIDD